MRLTRPCLALLALGLGACEPVPSGPGVPPDTDPASTDDTDVDLTGAFDDLPDATWSYLPVDGMICGNGAGTGVGVNPGTDPTKVVIVVQGGGACWDTVSCYVIKAATHVESGWGEAQLRSEVRPLEGSPLFDRGDSDNPWADATFLLVPYCTGDLHAGASEGKYDPLDPNRVLHHAGDANLRAVTALSRAALPDVTDAWVLGFSAGGYGVQLQADRFADTWPGARLALLADGSPMVQPGSGRWGLWRTAWKMRLPDDCEACLTSMTAVLTERATQVDGARMGLITTRNDGVITLFFGLALGGLPGPVNRLIDQVYLPDDQLNAFVVDGDQHVLSGNLDRQGPGGVTLGAWIAGWRDGTEAWADVY